MYVCVCVCVICIIKVCLCPCFSRIAFIFLVSLQCVVLHTRWFRNCRKFLNILFFVLKYIYEHAFLFDFQLSDLTLMFGHKIQRKKRDEKFRKHCFLGQIWDLHAGFLFFFSFFLMSEFQ